MCVSMCLCSALIHHPYLIAILRKRDVKFNADFDIPPQIMDIYTNSKCLSTTIFIVK